MLFRTTFAVLAACLIAASAPAAAAEALSGKQLYARRTCIACHGKDGAKAILSYPNLAGQKADYLFRQMEEIASGDRLSGVDARGYPRTQGMKDIMHLVSAEERQAIADWLATLPAAKPKPPAQPVDPARIAEGKALFETLECVSCHGPDGREPLDGMPAVAGQKHEYVVLQLTEIRDGVRKNGLTETMVPFTEKLTDDVIVTIADYLSQIDRTAP